MPLDTYIVIGTLFEISLRQPAVIRRSIGRPVSILIDDQNGQFRNPKGFPKAYEVLINAAFADPACKYVWVMGDDALPEGDCLARTQAVMEADETVGAVFPVEMWLEAGAHPEFKDIVTILPFDGRKVFYAKAGIPEVPGPLEDRSIPQIFPGMACACIRREAWQAIGACFDHSLGRGYCEDTDVGIRMWKAGYHVLNYRGAWFLHDRGATYNRLVADGVYRAEEPYEAAERLKVKWPFMWRNPDPQESSREIMEILKGWYEEAREVKAHEAPYPPVPVRCGRCGEVLTPKAIDHVLEHPLCCDCFDAEVLK